MTTKKATSPEEKIREDLQYLEQLQQEKKEEDGAVKPSSRGRGRPLKKLKEELTPISLKLPEKYHKKLDQVPEGRGAGTKMRFLLDYYFIFRERDQKQWHYFTQVLDKCGQLWKERNESQQVAKLVSAIRELKYLQKILGYSTLELMERLSGKDYALWERLQRVEEKGV